MPHPLSTIITAKLNGDDPHARTTITNAEAVEIRAELDWMHDHYSHYHCASHDDIDMCAVCGRDIRHSIHIRKAVPS